MTSPRRPYRKPSPVLCMRWTSGARTAAWERLWRRILAEAVLPALSPDDAATPGEADISDEL